MKKGTRKQNIPFDLSPLVRQRLVELVRGQARLPLKPPSNSLCFKWRKRCILLPWLCDCKALCCIIICWEEQIAAVTLEIWELFWQNNYISLILNEKFKKILKIV